MTSTSDRSREALPVGYFAQSIQRALETIETLAEAPPEGLTQTQLAERLGLTKSAVLRVLANLESRGFVEHDENKRFRIGIRLFSIGSQALSGSGLRIEARPEMEELCARVGESIYIGVLDGTQVLYIDRIESPQPVKIQSPIGAHRPLNATAMGKILLAYMDRDRAIELLERTEMVRRTQATVTDPEALLWQLDRAAAEGVAIDIDEWEEGLTCMAAPVRDRRGDVRAAIGISGPSWRLNQNGFDRASRLLRSSADEISRKLGFEFNRRETA